jgi:hypothetical protein
LTCRFFDEYGDSRIDPSSQVGISAGSKNWCGFGVWVDAGDALGLTIPDKLFTVADEVIE